MAIKKKLVAKKTGRKVNKTKEILKFLKKHPDAGNKDVVAALEKKGISVTTGYVSTAKSKAKRATDELQKSAPEAKAAGEPKKSAPSPAAKAAGEPKKSAPSPAAKAAGGPAYATLMRAKEMAAKFGGIDGAKKALDALAKLQ